MKRLLRLLGLLACALGFGAANLGWAADAPAEAPKLRERDKMCTVCHNENWRTPVL